MESPESQSSLPMADPCLSYWQQTTRSFPYLNHNQDTAVPKTAKYVILGSGIAGALVTYRLIEAGVPGQEIVILEAREAVGGASSRNSGHVRPDAFRGFQVYEKIHGKEQALKIIANERLVYESVKAFVQRYSIQCDFADRTTIETCLVPEFVEFNAQGFQAFKDAGGDLSHVRFYEEEEARERTGVKNTLCAYEWPAGSIHPAKLAHWLLTGSIEKGAGLFTHCPATSVAKSVSSSARETFWDIVTPRGTITASTVVHCTNAYLSHLLPEFASIVKPKVQQSHAFVPPAGLTGQRILNSTISLRHGLHHFYSVNQRPSDGIIILGSAASSPNVSQDTYKAQWSYDDRNTFVDIQHDTLANLEHCFPQCSTKALRPGEGLLNTWTGVCAMMPDLVPLVGRMEGASGQWVCAGFNAHGELLRTLSSARLYTKSDCCRNVKDLHLCNWRGKHDPWRHLGIDRSA